MLFFIVAVGLHLSRSAGYVYLVITNFLNVFKFADVHLVDL